MSPDNNSNPPAGNNNNNLSPPMENNNNSNPLTGNNNANTNTISLLPPSLSTTSSNSPASTQSSVTLGPLQGAFPNGIRITERIMSDPSWPSDLILDLGKGNWFEWSHMLNLSVRQCGLRPWLEGTLPCPDASVSPDTHYAWMQNDDAVSAFMLLRVSTADVTVFRVDGCGTAHDIFVRLRTLHENHGAHAQIRLLKKVLEIRLTYETPLRDTLAEMRAITTASPPWAKLKTTTSSPPFSFTPCLTISLTFNMSCRI
jgi:hypothetical protein